MSTSIRITGLEELARRARAALEATRQAMLEQGQMEASVAASLPPTSSDLINVSVAIDSSLADLPDGSGPLRRLGARRVAAQRDGRRRFAGTGGDGEPGPVVIILTPNPYDPSYGTSFTITSEDGNGGSYSDSGLYDEEPPRLGPPPDEDEGTINFYFVSYGHTVTAGIVMPSPESFGLYVFMFWYVTWRVSWNRIPGVRTYYVRETLVGEHSFSYDPSTGYIEGTPGAEDDAFYFKYIEPMAALTAREEFSSEVGGPTIPNVPGQSVLSNSTIIEWR